MLFSIYFAKPTLLKSFCLPLFVDSVVLVPLIPVALHSFTSITSVNKRATDGIGEIIYTEQCSKSFSQFDQNKWILIILAVHVYRTPVEQGGETKSKIV